MNSDINDNGNRDYRIQIKNLTYFEYINVVNQFDYTKHVHYIN